MIIITCGTCPFLLEKMYFCREKDTLIVIYEERTHVPLMSRIECEGRLSPEGGGGRAQRGVSRNQVGEGRPYTCREYRAGKCGLPEPGGLVRHFAG